MRFEWDETKNEINQTRHQGLSFEIAARVFRDPNFILVTDRIDEETGEQRFNAIGLIEATFLIVAHVYRETINGEEIIRIISARKANELERRLYFE